jgi:hypothetical protein
MKLTLEVTPAEGDKYQVTTNLYTIIQMERKFKIRASDLASGIAMEQLAFLAFEACKQSGVTVPAVFDDYLKRLEAVEVVSNEPTNPTEEAHSAEA